MAGKTKFHKINANQKILSKLKQKVQRKCPNCHIFKLIVLTNNMWHENMKYTFVIKSSFKLIIGLKSG